MSRAARAGCRLAIAALLGWPLAALAATAPTAEDLARCAAIASSVARLDCYDALAGRLAGGTPTAAAAAAGVAAAAPAAGARGAGEFGLARAQPPLPAEPPKSIEARVVRIGQDRSGRAVVVLDNQQEWTCYDPEIRLKSGDAVTVKRAALGSFLMTGPARSAYRVRRSK